MKIMKRRMTKFMSPGYIGVPSRYYYKLLCGTPYPPSPTHDIQSAFTICDTSRRLCVFTSRTSSVFVVATVAIAPSVTAKRTFERRSSTFHRRRWRLTWSTESPRRSTAVDCIHRKWTMKVNFMTIVFVVWWVISYQWDNENLYYLGFWPPLLMTWQARFSSFSSRIKIGL